MEKGAPHGGLCLQCAALHAALCLELLLEGASGFGGALPAWTTRAEPCCTSSGSGSADERDISVKGLEILKRCEEVSSGGLHVHSSRG